MKKYTYSLFAKLVYGYANIPLSLLLFFYLLFSVAMIRQHWFYILSAIMHALLLYVLNRFYLKSYKQFPYTIIVDNEKMICKNFFLSNKEVVIKFSEIDEIRGGIFSGNMARPIYIHDGKNDVTIGIRQHLKGFNAVLTSVLSNIEQKLYNELIEKIKEFGDKTTELREKRKSKIRKPVK
jgi:hypothetical protein